MADSPENNGLSASLSDRVDTTAAQDEAAVFDPSTFDPADAEPGNDVAPVRLTDRAVAKVRKLMTAEVGGNNLCLRVFVSGGGCSGFSYGFTFDEEVAEDDAILDQDGVRLLVDSLSYPYLAGSQVDYVEDLQGAQFLVTNPNAAATCGCGNSFAI